MTALDAGTDSTYCDPEVTPGEYRLAAVMYTDIVGFSRMMAADEAATLELLAEYGAIVRERVESLGGRVVRTVGDSILCEFANTSRALACARDIQGAAAERNVREPSRRMGLRIGLHVGDIYFSDTDAFGDGVTIANRLQEAASPGRICFSQDVHNQVSNKLDQSVRQLGAVNLPSLSRRIDAYELPVSPDAEYAPPGWQADRPDAGPADADRPDRAPSASDGARARTADDRIEARVKAFVLDEIRKAGRRVSVSDIRARYPDRGSVVDSALDSLAAKGFLTRTDRADSGPAPDVEVATPGGSRFYHSGTSARGARPVADDADDTSDAWDKKRYRGDEKETQALESGWDRALREPGPPDGAYDSLVEDYRDHAAQVAQKEKSGFRAHLVSYLGVNGGLFLLWAMTMFGSFPWFLIVLFAWGIGLASHYYGTREKIRESRDVDGAQGLTREQLRLYRRLARARSAWKGHLVSNVATSVFLVVLNLITGPGFFWAAFPVGFMAIGLLSHLPAYKSKEKRLLQRLRALGARIGGAYRSATDRTEREVAPPVTGSGPGAEAELVRRRLLAGIESSSGSSPLGEDFVPVLDNYVEQIKSLDRKSGELDQIMDTIPVAELERDLLSLRRKRQETESVQVRAEYDRSIEQIEKQQRSYGELRNEREMLRLRLSSGLNQLRQLEIDLARMKSASADENPASIAMLREKSEELSTYLGDLRDGYRELE